MQTQIKADMAREKIQIFWPGADGTAAVDGSSGAGAADGGDGGGGGGGGGGDGQPAARTDLTGSIPLAGEIQALRRLSLA